MLKVHPIQLAYLKAKVKHEMVLKIERECKLKVLALHEFYTEINPELGIEVAERITDPGIDYLMNNNDFERYCKLVWTALKARKVYVPDHNTTPDYQTRPALQKAEQDLINWGLATIKKDLPKDTHDTLQRGMHLLDIRDEFIRLTLKLAI